MIDREQLLIKNFKTGVTFYIFSDKVYNDVQENPADFGGPFPSYVLFNSLNVATSLHTFDGNVLWARNDNNNYVHLSELTSNYYLTGYSIVAKIESNLSDSQIETRTQTILSRLSDPVRFPQGTGSTNFVFHTRDKIDDFYVDIKLERHYKSLDTLKINNNIVNSLPEQEAKSGILFGRLMAIQKVKNESGQNIRIPLRNVPIGIFNPSDEFPQIFSTDDNGDRLSLNLKESTASSEYFDTISYNQDYNNYLKSGESFSAVPAQYKFITKTNDEGEFIIYNAPIGQQTVVFEVDLFKQGLTKDEIALNFFPFPTTDQPNIDTVPSFVYKQFPVDIVPAWGLSQTGYTNLDININLDLRKWTTYILPPVSFAAEKLEQTTAKNVTRTLKVDIRDMTSVGFERNPVEVVQVPDDLSRDDGAQYFWFDEFAQRRKRIDFNRFGCNVFKLPANMYDPNGYRTDKNGNPTNNKGVWLSGYQFRVYIDNTVSRTTGTYSYWNGSFYSRSHFHLNLTPDVQTQPTSSASFPAQIGVFPYEKPWSINYPEPYSIPKKPTQQRFYDGSQRMLHPLSTVGSPVYFALEPSYSDGDLVGNEVFDEGGAAIAGGFSVQNQASTWFFNRIANVATKNYMYKYESGVSPSETYANGYEPFWTPSTNPWGTDYPFAGVSSVIGGEKYQRVECGYGYFLRPQGWSRVGRTNWGADVPFDTANLDLTDPNNPGPSYIAPGVNGNMYSNKYTYFTMFNIDNQNLSLALNLDSYYKEGTLDLYRIVESGLGNILEPYNFSIPTYIKLTVKESKFAWRMFIKNYGDVAVTFRNSFNPSGADGGKIIFLDSNGVAQYASPGQSVTLAPGAMCQTAAGDANETIRFTTTLLPGNSSYNPSTNKYEKAIYEIGITYFRRTDAPDYSGPVEQNNKNLVDSDTDKFQTIFGNADVYSTENWFVRTHTNGGVYGINHEGITKDFFYDGIYYYNDSNIDLYSLRVETVGGDLWGTFNIGGITQGNGRYETL